VSSIFSLSPIRYHWFPLYPYSYFHKHVHPESSSFSFSQSGFKSCSNACDLLDIFGSHIYSYNKQRTFFFPPTYIIRRTFLYELTCFFMMIFWVLIYVFSSFLVIYLLVVGIELDAHCAFLDGILCIFSHLYFSYMIMFFTPLSF